VVQWTIRLYQRGITDASGLVISPDSLGTTWNTPTVPEAPSSLPLSNNTLRVRTIIGSVKQFGLHLLVRAASSCYVTLLQHVVKLRRLHRFCQFYR
jgi:hypothetical protein